MVLLDLPVASFHPALPWQSEMRNKPDTEKYGINQTMMSSWFDRQQSRLLY
ncbi:hypothetical protein [Acidovorax sp. SUPP3334]|uniref:hypothetical protein n=1 Tax=Acidovorax sp. SUPP3334 TaxID=2920881 RepID=UPI0023DE6A64|nr:hypothetical protein [Acidovorax sp. SUPP3334]GKT24997.1 hypothetical protein AVHM3334_16520 [Acidovorax sp. SUPP3334]